MKYIFYVVAVAFVYFFWSKQSFAKYEEPSFEQVLVDGRFEIRKYHPFHVAQTTVTDSFRPALNTGFRRIANYIFGGN